jgi:Replication-relaxation
MSQVPQRQTGSPLHIGPVKLPVPAATARKAKIHQRASNPAPMRLEERDVQVVEALAVHRFLSGEQLHRLLFRCGGSMVRRRLRALFDHGFIDRVAILGQPAAGIPPFVYVLGRSGQTVLTEQGTACSLETMSAVRLPQIRHRLLLNDFLVTLIEATRETPYWIEHWQAEEALLLHRDEGRGSAEQITDPRLGRPSPFMPDGFFELHLGNGESYGFFVEIDLSTHAQRVWRHRARLYSVYADPRLGLFRRRFGRENFRLLIVTTPDYRGRSRRDNILNSIRAEIGSTDMFLATTLPEVRADRVLGSIWHRADGTTTTCSLLPLVRVVQAVERGVTAPTRIHVGPSPT